MNEALNAMPVEVCDDCAYDLFSGPRDEPADIPSAFDCRSVSFDPEYSYCGCGEDCDDLTACPSLGQDGGFGTGQCDHCRTHLGGQRYKLLAHGYQDRPGEEA